MKIIYSTASTLNGFLTDANGSLDWLFAIPEGEQPDDMQARTGAYVMGSNTYEWILEATDVISEPEHWEEFFNGCPVFVFTSRSLEAPDGADVRFCSGEVSTHLGEIRQAAQEKDVWVQGGGDLAGQFFEAEALDEISIQFAPVMVSGGQPLLPRNLDHNQLSLVEARQVGRFALVRYEVKR